MRPRNDPRVCARRRPWPIRAQDGDATTAKLHPTTHKSYKHNVIANVQALDFTCDKGVTNPLSQIQPLEIRIETGINNLKICDT